MSMFSSLSLPLPPQKKLTKGVRLNSVLLASFCSIFPLIPKKFLLTDFRNFEAQGASLTGVSASLQSYCLTARAYLNTQK